MGAVAPEGGEPPAVYPSLWPGVPVPPTEGPGPPELAPEPNTVHGQGLGLSRSWEVLPRRASPPPAPASSWPQLARNPDVSTALTAPRPAVAHAVPRPAGEGEGRCLASSDLPGPPFPAHAPNVFDRWQAGPCSAIQIEKQAWQPALPDRNAPAAWSVRVDALMGAGEAEAGAGCPGGSETP